MEFIFFQRINDKKGTRNCQNLLPSRFCALNKETYGVMFGQSYIGQMTLLYMGFMPLLIIQYHIWLVVFYYGFVQSSLPTMVVSIQNI